MKHGKTYTRTYAAWVSMKQRCYQTSRAFYENYGGRGIKVCDRWRDNFQSFLDDMGEVPDGHTLDRIDNDGNYEPGNCRWATAKEQANNKRSNRFITHEGQTLSVAQWAELTGMKRATITFRLDQGMPPDGIFRATNLRTEQQYARTRCANGHPFSHHNGTQRCCRACLAENQRRYRARCQSKLKPAPE